MPVSPSARTVSIIVPCYNEAHTIGGLLRAILAQNLPADRLEVIIADGGSNDGTRRVIQSFAAAHPELQLQIVDNPARTIPAALNTAIGRACGEVVIRLDAHSAPHPDYVQRCLETLDRTQAANAGGAWDIQPGADTWIARGIAVAAAHPLGAGDARYRIRGAEGPVDTVPFGAFSRRWLEKAGKFNEELLTNEDYEYNVRIRRLGGVVWFNPKIRATYRARPDLRELARQYARYGYWKARMLLRFPRSLRWRQALPPIFALASLTLFVGGAFSELARRILALTWGAYLAILLLFGCVEAFRKRAAALLLSFPLAIATIHLAWGGAFWAGLLSGLSKRRPQPADPASS